MFAGSFRSGLVESRMRLGFVVMLCLLNAGCAIVRKDAEEPVDNEPRTAKAEPVLKPSEVLMPKSLSRPGGATTAEVLPRELGHRPAAGSQTIAPGGR